MLLLCKTKYLEGADYYIAVELITKDILLSWSSSGTGIEVLQTFIWKWHLEIICTRDYGAWLQINRGSEVPVWPLKWIDHCQLFWCNSIMHDPTRQAIQYFAVCTYNYLPYSRKFSYGANFCIFRMRALYAKIKTTKIKNFTREPWSHEQHMVNSLAKELPVFCQIFEQSTQRSVSIIQL